MKPHVLLSAFACDPYFGSDEEVGWQWAKHLARRDIDVTVMTRLSHKAAIEQEVARTGEFGKLRFAYVDMPRLHRVLSKINRRNQLYYYAWQWRAWREAARLHQAKPFTLVHHVTWVSFRQPSLMWKLGVPLIFGPVAGGDEIPPGYSQRFSLRQRLVEQARSALNALVRFDPFMRQTYAHARRVYFTSAAHLARVPAFVAAKARVELAIGVEDKAFAPKPPAHSGERLLFVGRAIGWKGMDIGLDVFAKALAKRPGLQLTVVGDGEDLPRWRAQAQALGVAHAVAWRGWLPKHEVAAVYAEHDVLFYPSLRDSGGFVVLEALEAGLPVVCFALGGPGVIVDDQVGAAVPAQPDLALTTHHFAEKLLEVVDRLKTDPGLPAACAEHARRFSWQALCARIYDDIAENTPECQ